MRFDGVCGGEEGRRRLGNYEEFHHRGRLHKQSMNHVETGPANVNRPMRAKHVWVAGNIRQAERYEATRHQYRPR
jgi:hypothetical protein